MTARSVTTCRDVLGSEPSNLRPEEPERSAVERESPGEELDCAFPGHLCEKAVEEKSREEI